MLSNTLSNNYFNYLFKIDRLEQHLKDVRRETRKDKETMVNVLYVITKSAMQYISLIINFLIDVEANINFYYI